MSGFNANGSRIRGSLPSPHRCRQSCGSGSDRGGPYLSGTAFCRTKSISNDCCMAGCVYCPTRRSVWASWVKTYVAPGYPTSFNSTTTCKPEPPCIQMARETLIGFGLKYPASSAPDTSGLRSSRAYPPSTRIQRPRSLLTASGTAGEVAVAFGADDAPGAEATGTDVLPDDAAAWAGSDFLHPPRPGSNARTAPAAARLKRFTNPAWSQKRLAGKVAARLNKQCPGPINAPGAPAGRL